MNRFKLRLKLRAMPQDPPYFLLGLYGSASNTQYENL
jgi:hypothetical protein